MRVPILPTLVVAAAIATMIALGIWQLGRMDEKAALIARAEQALQMSAEVDYPRSPDGLDEVKS